MGIVTLKRYTPHLVRCDFCQKTTHYTYNLSFDGIGYKFCSGIHAEQAHANFMEKKAKGITPTNPEPIEEIQADAGGIEAFE